YHEAEAFAQWAGARLPTEAEWLAAALIDDRVMKLQEYERFMFGGTPQSRPRAPLGFSGQEWVTGETVQEDYVQLSNLYEMNPMAFGWVKVVEGEKLAVARSGPQIVRCEGWQNATQHRMVAPARCHDIMITFRLAKNLE
ncbi:MAG TPA: SUMF1/EgtB/PvdO family nonheme iron enzyme, partial [Gemmatales bacterium]|nr:SUMF1/EgtB/PvdO family nonheme iron enzyme [Gemmatales bacterium]